MTLGLFADREEAALDLVLGLGAGGALVVLWQLACRIFESARGLTELLSGLAGVLSRTEIIGVSLLSGFAEELFFRGAVQGSFGIGWATLVFALLHSGPGPRFRMWTLFALIAGGLLGALVLWRDNLLAAILAHAVVNAINLWRLPAFTAGSPGADAGDGIA